MRSGCIEYLSCSIKHVSSQSLFAGERLLLLCKENNDSTSSCNESLLQGSRQKFHYLTDHTAIESQSVTTLPQRMMEP